MSFNRGNVVAKVSPGSPAATAGLRPGDALSRLNGVATASYADVQYALHRAPVTGRIPTSWKRAAADLQGALALPERWRESDLSWRASTRPSDGRPSGWNDRANCKP